eukprot:TRINITY_DN9025_c0_g1_i3.p1 TRINITY_DN9025_c0_g1~~TRINITY_DN9025_c0_g1_i3.p1  ORF type:complete len:760 (+),score=104.97 TRINITY_DN9025_c0_g1_i3:92-2281(+)
MAHLVVNSDIFSSKEHWLLAIQDRAVDLEDELWDLDKGLDYGDCKICEKPFQNIAAHIKGIKHYKALCRKANWTLPDSLKEYDQFFKLASGETYYFNHLSGEHGKTRAQGVGPTLQAKPTPWEATTASGHAWSAYQGYQSVYQRPGLEHRVETKTSLDPNDPNHLSCHVCGEVKTYDDFYKRQWKSWTPRCKECHDKPEPMPAPAASSCPSDSGEWPPWPPPESNGALDPNDPNNLRCATCEVVKTYDDFYRKQWKLSEPQCKECHDMPELTQCTICKQSLERWKFRNKMNWKRPACRECLEEKEKHEHDAMMERWQKELDDKIRHFLEKDERKLRELFHVEIVQHCQIPASHATASFLMPAAKVLWLDCIRWGERLANLVQGEMEKENDSPLFEFRHWRVETPSRDHATDKAAADRFKTLEDEGDRLVYDISESILKEFVARERKVKITAKDLSANVMLTVSGRSWQLGDEVILSIQLFKDSWRQEALQHLMPEPRDKGNLTQDSFVQFDTCARDLIESLPFNTILVVKLVTARFWSSLEDHLYKGDEDCEKGSHNQIFLSYSGNLGGSGQQANRTECMNLFSDVLGFYDSHGHHMMRRDIWAQHFGHLFPARLHVCYGGGKEYKCDKEWKFKREANVAEALIGALYAAGFQNYAHAAVALCFVCSIARPDSVMPSNWDMSVRRLMTARNPELAADDSDALFILKHIDVQSLRKKMEAWLLSHANTSF